MLKIVLLADDNADVREVFREMLESLGCLVVEANTGLAAVTAAVAHRPHLILTDVEMPELDGIEAARRIKNIPELATIPIIAITGQAELQRGRALAAGCSQVLNKPLDLNYLAAVVNEHLFT